MTPVTTTQTTNRFQCKSQIAFIYHKNRTGIKVFGAKLGVKARFELMCYHNGFSNYGKQNSLFSTHLIYDIRTPCTKSNLILTLHHLLECWTLLYESATTRHALFTLFPPAPFTLRLGMRYICKRGERGLAFDSRWNALTQTKPFMSSPGTVNLLILPFLQLSRIHWHP